MKNRFSGVGNIERKLIKVVGLRLNTLIAKNSVFDKKPTIILIQGLAIVARYWMPTITELSEDFNVYAFDLPGFGQSDKPDHILNISELSDCLNAWLESLGINRAVFVGHSFGCQVIADFALRQPEKIEKIVLAAPTVDERARTFLKVFIRLLVNARNEPFSLIGLAVESFFRFGLIRQIKTLKFALADRIEDKVPHIEIPTLVLRGSKDTVVPEDWTEKIAGLLPQSRLVTISGGTHGFNYSLPKEFANVIREFLGYNTIS